MTQASSLALPQLAVSAPWWARPLVAVAQRLEAGSLALTFPDGATLNLAGRRPGPSADMTIVRPRAVRRLVLEGDIGLAEGYRDGDWDSRDLVALIELAALNDSAVRPASTGLAPWRLWHRALHRLHANSRAGSRRNIMAHYDLGNDFYAKWLDETMTYSSALFTPHARSLPDAQQAKYERLMDTLGLSADDTVLEIGCGWDGFAEAAARRGAQVTGLTISPAQLAFARERLSRAGLGSRADLRQQDYRDVGGTFDRVASIEMFEAVGKEHWPRFFATVYDRLKPGGIAAIQVITIAEDRFSRYRREADFIQRLIFPGGMLPSERAFVNGAEAAGFTVDDVFRFGGDYARTLNHWARAFRNAEPTLASMGFDVGFRRLWTFYLAYCEAGFRAGSIDTIQVRLVRP